MSFSRAMLFFVLFSTSVIVVAVHPADSTQVRELEMTDAPPVHESDRDAPMPDYESVYNSDRDVIMSDAPPLKPKGERKKILDPLVVIVKL